MTKKHLGKHLTYIQVAPNTWSDYFGLCQYHCCRLNTKVGCNNYVLGILSHPYSVSLRGALALTPAEWAGLGSPINISCLSLFPLAAHY